MNKELKAYPVKKKMY